MRRSRPPASRCLQVHRRRRFFIVRDLVGGAARTRCHGAGVRLWPFSVELIPTTWLTLWVRLALSVTRAVIVTERSPAGSTSEPPTTQSTVVSTKPSALNSLPAMLKIGARLEPAGTSLLMGASWVDG